MGSNCSNLNDAQSNGCAAGPCNAGGCGANANMCDSPSASEMGGIGAAYRFAVRLGAPVSFEVVLEDVYPGGPAHNKLVPGDRILEIDGAPVDASQPNILEQVAEKIQGPAGTPVHIKVERTYPHGQIGTRERTIVRAAVMENLADSPPALVGVPKCMGCPIGNEQPGRCGDCPTPLRKAIIAARALAAQSDTSSFPPLVKEILRQTREATSRPDDAAKAITYAEARADYHAAKRAVEASQDPSAKDLQTLKDAEKNYRVASRALDTGILQRPGH